MRFCPFCAKETSDDAGRCVHCGRRLGARTTQNSPVPLPAQQAGLRPGMLGLGAAPGRPADPSAGGPTVIGGPAGLSGDYADSPSGAISMSSGADTVVREAQATQVRGSSQPPRGQANGGARPGRHQGDAALDEETRLPPPAPGMIAPLSSSFDPPTLPGLPSRRRAAHSTEVGSLDGLRGPVTLHPGGEGDLSLPQALPLPLRTPAITAPDLSHPGGADPSQLTSQTALPDLSGLARADFLADALPKISQNNIPALPPPPVGPLAGSTVTPTYPPVPSAATTGPLPVLSRQAAPGRLSAIPAAPSSAGLLDSVLYLWPVLRGVWARRGEQSRIRGGLVEVQQSLDGVLLELGRAAHEERLDTPPLTEEMGLVRQAEERRDHASRQADRLRQRKIIEEQRMGVLIAEQQQALGSLGAEAERLDAELRERAGQRRTQVAEIARIDAVLRKLGKAAETADARVRAEQDPQAVSQARARGDSARGQTEALLPQREAALREVSQLDGPIAELTQKLGKARSELGLRQKELARHHADKDRLLAGIEADLRLCQAEQEAAAREMQQRMMTIGTLVNLTRPSGPRYAALYGRVDEIKARLADAESHIAQLDTESSLYDQKAVQKGLILVGASALALGLLIALFYIVLALVVTTEPIGQARLRD